MSDSLSNGAIESIPSSHFEATRIDLARRKLSYFTKQFWSTVEPGTQLSWNWHLDVLCRWLEDVTYGRRKNLIVNIPPGTGKSLIVSVFWPAWEWATNAGLRYLTASYSDKNTIRDNRRLKAIVTSDKYQSWFWDQYITPGDLDKTPHKVTLSSDQSAKIRFDTTEKGWRIASSVEGVGTGEHPDRIITDDPHKASEARSKVKRDNVGAWKSGTISTRKARDPADILVMQRLHMDDQTAKDLRHGYYDHLCLPMRYEVVVSDNPKDSSGRWDCDCHQQPDPYDIRTKPSELLWPDRFPEEKVRQMEIELGEFDASGQLQQRPVPLGGGLFKYEWFLDFVEETPVNTTWGRGWDTAATDDAGDWTAGVHMGISGDTYYVDHVRRARVEDADPMIKLTAQVDGTHCRVREETEGGSSGKKVIASHVKMLAGYDFEGVSISGAKDTRARPYRVQCEAGNVKIVKRPGEDHSWIQPYIDELCVFPFGEHDDQVDGSSCIFNDLALAEEKQKKFAGAFGRKAVEARRQLNN